MLLCNYDVIFCENFTSCVCVRKSACIWLSAGFASSLATDFCKWGTALSAATVGAVRLLLCPES